MTRNQTHNLQPVVSGSGDQAASPPVRTMTFYAPGIKRHKTAEYAQQNPAEFVSISVTGTGCALACEHCKSGVLRGMAALPRAGGSLYDLCADAKSRGARGVLISGGSDRRGRVPLLKHMPDMIRVSRDLGLLIRVHPGLPDDATCAGLGQVGIDGAMIDVIGHGDTIRDVYHLDAQPDAYDSLLARLARYGVPIVPHIVIGLHFGRMLGEWCALEMIARHRPRLLVLVVLMPLTGTPMAGVAIPPAEEIGAFFRLARRTLPHIPVMLGCARPLGPIKAEIDRMAVDAGLDGIAYPAQGTIAYAQDHNIAPRFVDACCGVSW